MVCRPGVSPPDGAHDQAPLSDAVPLHSAVDPSFTVTVPPGTAVPLIDPASGRDCPLLGVVIDGAGGNSVCDGTAGPVTDMPTLCTVIGCWPSSRKSAPAFCKPPK